MRLYVFYYGHNGDALTTRPLLKRLKELGHEVAIGCYSNHVYLFEDLGITVAPSPFDDACGYTFDEVRYFHTGPALTTRGTLVSAWCGTYPDLDEKYGHSWANIAETFNRQIGFEWDTELSPSDVPMIFDWKQYITDQPRKIVFVENGSTRGEHCAYEFDVMDLCRRFSHLNFICTDSQGGRIPAFDSGKVVMHMQNLNLVEVSKLSEHCIAIVGKGSGPFFATFTEANRTKSRCVMSYETKAPFKGPFWPYPGQNTLYAKTTEELYTFLEAL